MESLKDIKFEVIKKITDTRFKFKDLGKISGLDSTSPPSVFVGSKLRYPLVNVGILSPLERDENAWLYNSEKTWANENYEIKDVLQLRNSLLNSRFQAKVADARLNKKFVEIAKEVAIASKQVDVEIELEKTLRLRMQDKIDTPHGLRGRLKKAKITSNVKVAQEVDKVVSDDELKASEGMKYLYKRGFDEYTLNKILTVGVLGMKKNRRLVPTSWSITATDDTIGKQLINEIKEYKELENYELFYGEFLGNQYLIMLFPNVWSYELFELYWPGSSWNPTEEIKASTDLEFYKGRTTYAASTAGGYYASRLPILEYLKQQKRQASILVIRLETPTYWAALGVWVCREACRKVINRGKMEFSSKEEMLAGAKAVAKNKYNFDISNLISQSKLLNRINTQKRLRDWF